MALKKITLTTSVAHHGRRLDVVLAELLRPTIGEPLSKGKVRKLIIAGAVYLNGSRIRIASKEIRPGARLYVYLDQARLMMGGTSTDIPFEMDSSRILFEDEFLIIVDKPAGLPTQPTLDEARNNLYAVVKKFLATRDSKPQVYLGLHHRLDKDTSGIVLFTKDQRINAAVAALFSTHKIQKIYQAITSHPQNTRHMPPGGLMKNWVVQNYLGKVGKGKDQRQGSVRSGGSPAKTEFILLKEYRRALLVEARPKTGRTHQIRVHLSEGGFAILGDPVYGTGTNKALGALRTMLHASGLTFIHPITNLEVSIKSSLPEDFMQCLKRLQTGAGDGGGF